jgi:hypothetical protein
MPASRDGPGDRKGAGGQVTLASSGKGAVLRPIRDRAFRQFVVGHTTLRTIRGLTTGLNSRDLRFHSCRSLRETLIA